METTIQIEQISNPYVFSHKGNDNKFMFGCLLIQAKQGKVSIQIDNEQDYRRLLTHLKEQIELESNSK